VGVQAEAKTVVITADDALAAAMPGLPSTAWVKGIMRMTFK